jgi:hypothetical protein
MVITMFVPEEPHKQAPFPFLWAPFLRLVVMTAAFTAVILVINQLVVWGGRYIDFLQPTPQVILYGIVGFVAMASAVLIGVGVSIRIGLGTASPINRAFAWWVISRLCFLIGSTNIASFLVFFLQGRFGYAREEAAGPASTLVMFVGIFILIAALPSGWLSDRFGRKPVLTASGIIAAMGTLIVILAPGLPFLYLGSVLIGIATGQFYAVNWALGTNLVPKDQAGRYLGLSNLAGAGAGAIGAYIGGPIADLITITVPELPGMGYVVLFLIYAALFLGSIAALRGIRIPVQAS